MRLGSYIVRSSCRKPLSRIVGALVTGTCDFSWSGLVKKVAVVSDEPFFIGPDGKRTTLADLPPRDLLNLSSAQKSMVVAAVCQGLITLGEACERYHLSLDEYLSWHRSFAGGAGGERQ